MTRQFSLLALTGFALAVSGGLLAQDSDHAASPAVMQAVDAVFPNNLRFNSAPPSGEGAPVEPYHSCATVVSKAPDGTPNLVAAGYSGRGAEIAMLSYKPGGARIMDSVSDNQLWLTDGECDAQVVNLADPAQAGSPLANTVQISFDGPDWLFTWDGKKLQNITALESEASRARHNRPSNSAMFSTQVVDVDHAGAMQIAGKNGDADNIPQDDGISSTGTLTLFRYNGTAYAPAQSLLYLSDFNSSVTDPQKGWIDMHQPPAPSYQLRIVNGDRDGSNRAASASIDINGVNIVSPTEVNQGVETLTRTIELQKVNQITVTVQGPVNSHLYVTVQ